MYMNQQTNGGNMTYEQAQAEALALSRINQTVTYVIGRDESYSRRPSQHGQSAYRVLDSHSYCQADTNYEPYAFYRNGEAV